MNTSDFLSSDILATDSPDVVEATAATAATAVMQYDLNDELKKMSYSSILTLHECPRKFQLYRLNSNKSTQETVDGQITLTYGGVVGIGLQAILEGKGEDQAIWEMFLEWEVDLAAADDKRKKSLYSAIFAVQQFLGIQSQGYLRDYELVYLDNGRPATELSFIIDLGDGFTFRGYVDAVLRNIHTGEIVVLELKTTAANVTHPSMYKNSNQAIGYSVVLDALFDNLASYTVLYLVYNTKSQSYTQFPFEKSLLQKALWLQDLWLEKQKIQLYMEHDFPMHGESCYNYYKDCPYMGLCTLSTEYLISPSQKMPAPEDFNSYDFQFKFADLVEAQIARGNGE